MAKIISSAYGSWRSFVQKSRAGGGGEFGLSSCFGFSSANVREPRPSNEGFRYLISGILLRIALKFPNCCGPCLTYLRASLTVSKHNPW